MKVGVIRLGYVGVPLAVAFAAAGDRLRSTTDHDELRACDADLDIELARADLACVITAHPELDYRKVVGDAALVLDFRGITRGIEASNLVRL
jgi:UDP-N-acetyl-D-mannosaminuronate dehydrogenase